MTINFFVQVNRGEPGRSPHLPQERNPQSPALPFSFQKHLLQSRRLAALARVLLALHGGEARTQKDRVFAVLGLNIE